MSFRSFATAFMAFILSSHAVHAHHGQGFLLLEDYQTAAPGQGYFLSNFEWERGADGSEFGFSPSLWLGLMPRLSVSVEADIRDEVTEDWRLSSVTPAVRFQLTSPSSTFPIRVGLSAGYQFGMQDGEPMPAEHEHGDEHGDEHKKESASHHEETAEPAAHHHGGASIHAHGTDAFVGRLVLQADLTDKTRAVLNILAMAGDETAWGYAFGLRQKVAEHFAVGAEAMGDFKSTGWQELVAGAYYEPSPHLTLKLGVGCGLTDATPDLTVRTGLIWRF